MQLIDPWVDMFKRISSCQIEYDERTNSPTIIPTQWIDAYKLYAEVIAL